MLGSTLHVSIDFLDLTLDTTIHAMSVKMVQETATPIKTALPEDLSSPPPPEPATRPTPSRARSSSSLRGRSDNRPALLSRLSSLFAGMKDKPHTPQTSILDEYVLHSEGVDHYVTSQGFGVRPGMYLWRGEAGRNIDRTHEPQQPHDEEYLDEYKLDHHALPEHDGILRTTSSLRLNRSVRLPSELQDAHPTSSTLAPVLARISHRVAVNIIYSVLGQDASGKPIKGSQSNGSLYEGAMRQVTLVFEVGLMPCVVVPSTIRPPVYTDDDVVDMVDMPAPASSPRRMFRRFSMDTVRSSSTARVEPPPPPSITRATTERLLSSAIHHSRAFRASNGLVVTGNRVFYSDQEVEEAVNRHHREKGACACLMV